MQHTCRHDSWWVGRRASSPWKHGLPASLGLRICSNVGSLFNQQWSRNISLTLFYFLSPLLPRNNFRLPSDDCVSGAVISIILFSSKSTLWSRWYCLPENKDTRSKEPKQDASRSHSRDSRGGAWDASRTPALKDLTTPMQNNLVAPGVAKSF